MVPAMRILSSILLLHLFVPKPTLAGNVLVWPTEHSHWINMKVILEALEGRGHSVTLLHYSASTHFNDTGRFKTEIFKVSFSLESSLNILNGGVHLFVNESPSLSSLQFILKMRGLIKKRIVLNKQVCDGVLRNEELLDRLRQSHFEVLLSDPMFPCAELVADKLGIPFVYTLRFSFGSSMERLCGQLPAPSSYVPAVPSQQTDTMDFQLRLKNFMSYLGYDLLFNEWSFSNWDSYYREITGRPTSLCEMMGKAEIWLIRTYWDFEFPRPYLPNFQFVGGLHCRPAKALPEDMEEFAQSSGDHGIVVLTFGSMIKNLTREKANLIASALGQIPQKVLWRYSGETPETLAPNTRLYNWIPQNDLLGHPKTRAFITHGGTNGIYEAIYHGIPMVGIPMFGDQPDNMVHMKAKGAAVVVNFNTMTSQDLVDALNTVINNPTYKESAMKLSRIHHDQPVKPLDTAVFWIEFVMRHKGAKHLRPAAHNLTWYQYHCLDVIAFLLVCILTSVIITYKCCIFSFRKCFKRSLKKSKRE
ncbi:UDP-glucuronosyltransferase 2A1-like isoform X5 [Erpetoichthys calabaricus]|uniref:UDP-glucuronosyltransferase 2A1-like isoform X5 n=1 Tax=Erpetoichthys calabaricus TaxID=27687 RepID=UPI002234193F|nr:UDP-glucuronosyltransferase 2A1-like isoform X5 [Erpetoichthys calabaricus]